MYYLLYSLIVPYNSKNVPWKIVGMLRNFLHFSFTRSPVSFVCCSVYFHKKQTDGTKIFTILLTSLGLKVINFLMRNATYLAFLSVLVILICKSNKKKRVCNSFSQGASSSQETGTAVEDHINMLNSAQY